MADELKARLSADISGFQSGMSAAANSTVTLKGAAAQLQTALSSLTEAEAQFGAAAAQGSQQASSALAEYRSQVSSAQAVVDSLAGSETREIAVLRSGISARMAASTELRVLEGNMMGSTRAAGALLSTLPGVGSAMAAAFPIFGAAALVGVLVSVGEKLDEVYEKYIDLDSASAKFADTVRQQASTDFINVHSLEEANDRLDRAAASATNLRAVAEQIHSISFSELMQGVAGGNFGQIVQAIAGLAGAHAAASGSVQNQAQVMALTERQVELQHQLRTAQIEARAEAGEGAHGQAAITAELQKQVALHAEERRYNNERDRAMGNPISANSGAQLESIQNSGSQARASSASAALSAKQNPSTAVKDAIREQEEQVRFLAQAHETLERTWTEGERADEEATRSAQHADAERTAAWKKGHEEMLATIHRETEATQKQAGAKYSATEHNTQYQVRSGQLSPRAASQQMTAASHADEDTQVGALKSEQANYTPSNGPKEAAQFQQIQDQITQIQQRASQQRQQIAQAEALRQQTTNTQMFNNMYAPMQTFTDHWLTSGQRMGAAFAKMGDDYAMTTINALMKIGAQELIGLVLHNTVGSQQRLDDAKTAASGAYAATAGIPYIGPVLAPVAAATAFAAVAAFDVGSDSIPHTGMAMIHANERIIPSSQNERITKALEGGAGGSSGGSNHFHYSPQISAIDGASVASMASSHSQTFMRQASRMMRLQGGQ